MKKLITLILIATVFINVVNAQESRYYNIQSGSGYTKGDAVASALLRLPYGAKIEKVNINGYAIHQCVKGAGYVQTYGSHKATIHYSK